MEIDVQIRKFITWVKMIRNGSFKKNYRSESSIKIMHKIK